MLKNEDCGTYEKHLEKMEDQCMLGSRWSIRENMELKMAVYEQRNKIDKDK